MLSQSDRLGKEPIPKLLVDFAVPAVVGMFVMSFHNIIDTFFVSRYIGTIGVGALSVAMPVQLITLAVSAATGIGGASIISRWLGANEPEKANKVFGNVLGIASFFSILGIILGICFLTPILYLFGSSEGILPYAGDYLSIILYGTPFFVFGMSTNNIIRSEGGAKPAMIAVLTSAILNIILTPIFIFILGLGIKGAAYATVIAQGISVVYQYIYFASEKSIFTFKAAYLLPEWSIVKQIVSIGSSFFASQAAGSLVLIVVNHTLVSYGGDLAISVFGILYKVIQFTILPLMGISQGLLPLVGYNYGARQYERVSESIALAIKSGVLLSLVAFVVLMSFPKFVISIFTGEAAALEMGGRALRILFSMNLTVSVQLTVNGVFQALGRAKEAFILSMARQIFILIPLVLILPIYLGLTGIWLSYPTADFLSALIVLWFIRRNKDIFVFTRRGSRSDETAPVEI